MALDVDGGDAEFVDDVCRSEIGRVMGEGRDAAIDKFLPDSVPAIPAPFLIAKVAWSELPEKDRALARRSLAGIVLGGLRSQQLQRTGKSPAVAVLVKFFNILQ